jgi:hypothetical protein
VKLLQQFRAFTKNYMGAYAEMADGKGFLRGMKDYFTSDDPKLNSLLDRIEGGDPLASLELQQKIVDDKMGGGEEQAPAAVGEASGALGGSRLVTFYRDGSILLLSVGDYCSCLVPGISGEVDEPSPHAWHDKTPPRAPCGLLGEFLRRWCVWQ